MARLTTTSLAPIWMQRCKSYRFIAYAARPMRGLILEGSALAGESTLAGQAIGRYTLDRPLAQLGIGSVWLAHRSDGRFEGQVAIKFSQSRLARAVRC